MSNHALATLTIGGPCAGDELDFSSEDLAALPAEHQVPDVSKLAEGRSGQAVRLAALAQAVQVSPDARFVHVASIDGSFTANIPIEQALGGGMVLFGHEGGELPPRFGGPFRLLFVDGEDCSINVKFLGQLSFVREPGEHSARCVD